MTDEREEPEPIACPTCGHQVSVAELGVEQLPVRLTPREADIVGRLILGQRVAVIALESGITPSTVRNHIAAVLKRAGRLKNQAELIEWCRAQRATRSVGDSGD